MFRRLSGVPMHWETSPQTRLGNFGDMLAPVIVAALTGRSVGYRHVNQLGSRLITAGTIGQAQCRGRVHVWGAGFSGQDDQHFSPAGGPLRGGVLRRSLLQFKVHAARGPYSADVLRSSGFTVPDVHGDPVWLLPSIWPARTEKQYELGVVLHISETDDDSEILEEAPLVRYQIPPDMVGSVKLITMRTGRDMDSIRRKVDEFTSCKRILSTSLHGMVMAEAYGIPCAVFDFHDGDSTFIETDDDTCALDHRMRDFYAGLGQSHALVLRQLRHLPTDWEAAIRFIDQNYCGDISYEAGKFLDSFPNKFGPLLSEPISDLDALDQLVPLMAD